MAESHGTPPRRLNMASSTHRRRRLTSSRIGLARPKRNKGINTIEAETGLAEGHTENGNNHGPVARAATQPTWLSCAAANGMREIKI